MDAYVGVFCSTLEGSHNGSQDQLFVLDSTDFTSFFAHSDSPNA